MAKLKKCYFYYGAILNAILQCNEDASPSLILNDGERKQVYRILTNTSKHECIAYFKYATSSRKSTKNDSYRSWVFAFTDDDKNKLNEYHDKSKMPIFIYLMCAVNDLIGSEIVVLKYDEFIKVVDNKTITIGREDNKNNFYFFTNSKSKNDADRIARNRINMRFDDLISI